MASAVGSLPPLPDLIDGLVEPGMAKVGGDLDKWLKDKVAIVEIGMGDGEAIGGELLAAEEEEIEVDAPRALVEGAAAAHGGLDMEHEAQEVEGVEARLEVEAGVEKRRLVLDKAGGRLIDGTAGENAELALLMKGLAGLLDGVAPGPDIGAQGDIGVGPGRRWSAHWWRRG